MDCGDETKPADAAETEQNKNKAPKSVAQTEEIGGPQGPEPTRFGDWEKAGRCTDF